MKEVAKTLTPRELLADPRHFIPKNDLHSKIHSKRIDQILGYRIKRIEVNLLKKYQAYYKLTDESNKKQHFEGTQTWIGLHPQTLQTPYGDIFEALCLLKRVPVSKLIDIGAAYGRVGIVSSCLFPKARFIGYEVLDKRVEEGNRVFNKLGLINNEIVLQNVLEEDFVLPQGEIYFIYDFSDPGDVVKILDQLAERYGKYEFFIITKGDGVEELMQGRYHDLWFKRGFLEINSLRIFRSPKLQ